jgi:tetratricopeptide (TPR) repeat protein
MGTIAAGLLLLGVVAGGPAPAFADGNDSKGGGSANQDPAYAQGVRAIKGGDYTSGIKLMEGVLAKDGKNADAYNWLAYATRKGGDPAKSIPIYQKALAIDPKHRGAHEYIGEAYLALGDLPKAKEHLAALDKLCFMPCEEYSDLKKAVQQYEASKGNIKPASK